MDCDFARNPTIIFGKRDLECQLEDLVREYSPIRAKDLVQLIVDNYGFDERTIRGAYLPLLKKYSVGGVYCSYKDNTDSSESIA